MRFSRRRRAVLAVGHVVSQSILHIRAMAYRRTPLCDEFFPNADYIEQIRLLAAICDTLVPGVGHDPLAALRYTWSTRGESGRQWIRVILADADIAIDDLIDTTSTE